MTRSYLWRDLTMIVTPDFFRILWLALPFVDSSTHCLVLCEPKSLDLEILSFYRFKVSDPPNYTHQQLLDSHRLHHAIEERSCLHIGWFRKVAFEANPRTLMVSLIGFSKRLGNLNVLGITKSDEPNGKVSIVMPTSHQPLASPD